MPAYPLGQLAAQLGAKLLGDPGPPIGGLADLGCAREGQLAPFTDPSRLAEAVASSASALLVGRPWPELPQPQLLAADPRRALALLIELFVPQVQQRQRGIDARAAIDPSAAIDSEAWIGPFAYVGAGAVIGRGTQVEPFCYLGDGCQVGADCYLAPGATVLAGSQLADGARLGPGAVIGWDGFGFVQGEGGGWAPLRSLGAVSLGPRVEVGALSCVDRGTLGNTTVAAGTKIDNLVQVGHNCQIEPDALLCAQTGLAGSVRVGQGAILGGQVGVADHRRVGQRARVGAHSGVAQDVAAGAMVSGYPAIEHRRWLRASALFARLGELTRQLRALSRSAGDDSP